MLIKCKFWGTWYVYLLWYTLIWMWKCQAHSTPTFSRSVL